MPNYYVLRSKLDGKYLTARLTETEREASYLLIFKEDFEALSYVNTHARDLSERLGVESVSQTQMKGLLQRWSYQGFGLVEDPLLPQIKFLSVDRL
jgi:hypothetical protein